MSDLSRRTVLATTAAASLLPHAALAQTGTPILKRRVPQTGFMLPVVGIGTSQVFEFEDNSPALEERKEVVRNLVAGGGSLIDTAAGYGSAEMNVGLVVKDTGLRSKLFLATKFSSRDSFEEAETELRQSMGRLKHRLYRPAAGLERQQSQFLHRPDEGVEGGRPMQALRHHHQQRRRL